MAPNEYVDARTCAGCHASIAQTYAETGMARAFSVPEDGSVPNPKAYFHAASGTWYENFARDGAWFQRWWQIGPKGERESAGEARIDFVMGSGNHVRTYLHRTGRGTLTELPLAWYAEGGGTWALNPGFDRAEPPLGRKIGYDCMFCHNGYPAGAGSGVEPVFAGALPMGIDCQRCHGPGGNHIRTVQQAGVQAGAIRASIVNPARLGKEREMDVCAQCHLETTVRLLPNVIRRYERGPFSYRPGEPLSAFQLAFDHAPGTGREDKFEIVSSVYRLRQSKCFVESKGELGCRSCHNPHDIRHGQAGLGGYNQACGRCHAAGTLPAASHPAATNCVGCHMPKRRTEDVVHAVVTDHRIQRRGPANALAPMAERHGPQWEYRGEVVPYGDGDELYTAVAQVMHESNLAAGIPRLQELVAARKPARAEFYLELGDALQRAGRAQESAAAYRAGLEKEPESARLWARLAMPLRSAGQPKEAFEALRKSLTLDPNQPKDWVNLGLLEAEMGDKPGAIVSFRKAIALDPETAEAHAHLAGVMGESGEAELRVALRLRPSFTLAHGQLAYLLANRGDLEGAVWHFARAGEGAANQFSYGVTLVRMKRFGEARVQLQKSLAADPNQPMAHELLGRLLAEAGNGAEAVTHFREAIRLRPDFGQAHLNLGAALVRQGKRAEAAAEFRLAQADPDPQIQRMASAGLAASEGR